MNASTTGAALRRGAACALAAGLLVLTAAAHAQYANDDLPDWKEGEVPTAPAYSLSGLIDVEMPRGSSVKMGVDPKTITIDKKTGIVRYVVVARGPSAVNATYEGIRCATGEFRIYARQVQGSEWAPNTDADWKSMVGQNNIMVRHPMQLARGGLCQGTTVRQDVKEAVRDLQSGNQALYY